MFGYSVEQGKAVGMAEDEEVPLGTVQGCKEGITPRHRRRMRFGNGTVKCTAWKKDVVAVGTQGGAIVVVVRAMVMPDEI